MKAKIFTLFLALYAPVVLAQDYSLFHPEYEITYSGEGGSYDHRVLKVTDYEVIEGDTVFETYHQPGGLNCAQPDGPSWLGSVITRTAGQQTIFENLHGQEILFENLQMLSVGDSWTCWESELHSVEATVVEVTEESFLNVTDSVKTVSFQKYDNEGEPTASMINDKTVKVSKHYSMIQTLPWVMFPDIPLHPSPTGSTPTYPESGTEFSISGSTELNAGVYSLTAREMFDFEIGDVFHILEVENRLSYTGKTDTIKTILQVIDKTVFDDSVTYEFERELNEKSLEFEGEGGPLLDSSLIYIHDTVEKTYDYNPYLNKVPFETAYQYNDDSTQANVVYHHLYVSEMGRRAKNTAVYATVQWMWETGTDCLDAYAFDGCGPYNHYYISNLGGPYHQCVNWIVGSETRKELVYYEQNGEAWGDPFDNLITHTDGVVDNRMVRVYPNPASQYFVAETGEYGDCSLTLYNTVGEPVFSKDLLSAKTRIVPDLKPGIYFYRISQNNQTIHSGKLLFR